MKNLEMWHGKWQDAIARANSPEADDCDRELIVGELRHLQSTMEDNKPRKSKNQAFKMYIYEKLLNDVQMDRFRLQSKTHRG